MNNNLRKRIMKTTLPNNKSWLLSLVILYTLGSGLLVNAGECRTTITTFDAPSGGTARGQGTVAFAINSAGAITGFFRDANSARHGFLRAPDGSFTIIDDPAAGTCSTSCGTIGTGQGTRAFAINPSGQIVGFYSNNRGKCHGYVRAANGTFTQIDAPHA